VVNGNMQEHLFAFATTAREGRSAVRLPGAITVFPVGKKKPDLNEIGFF